jgi:ABC-2 type transport system permease protein
MAVHRRVYRPFEGLLSPLRWRWLVLMRYAWRELLASRLFVALVLCCFVPVVVELATIWLVHSPAARALLHMSQIPTSFIDARFFYRILAIQGGLALFVAASVAPQLVAPDLADGALALYLSRPLSRTAYVAGKTSVLLVLLSAITWLPGLLLFGLQGGLEGGGWFASHLRIPVAIFLAAALWITLLSFLSIALSAWVRWRLAATGLFFGVFFVGAGMAGIVNVVLRTEWGWLLNLNFLIDIVWRGLFGLPRESALPPAAAWAALLAVSAFCFWILDRRLRAREVVR